MCICPELVDVNGVRSIMLEVEVDPVSIAQTTDMMKKFRMSTELLHKRPGDHLSGLDLFIVRRLMETLVV